MARGHDSRWIATGALAVAATVHAGPALRAHSPGLRRALAVRDRLADPGAVALTFDDGPHPEGTPAAATIAQDATRDLHGGEVILLHDADHYSAPGSWRATVQALPRILERIAAAGLAPAAASSGRCAPWPSRARGQAAVRPDAARSARMR
jgi:peptidoglycan/xylan/chitin deacetylase (PgdA/CDA1 family)